jgi:penicillin V acylase-like amidase (Ntn superfamily)
VEITRSQQPIARSPKKKVYQMKQIVTSLLLLCIYNTANSCTTFFLNKNGQLVFGRNYDWITDAGMVYTNLKGISKTSFPNENGSPISWVSKYGSITFNQYGKEMPTGGMNEKGLVVELMWLDETVYPAADQRPSVGVLQWLQYQLDNCATIDEVIATDKVIRIGQGATPLHYLIADANGKAATIEFLNGKMTVHKGSDLTVPVLTNSIYAESTKTYSDNKEEGSGAYGNNSLERFGTACKMVQDFQHYNGNKSITEYAFDILKAVDQDDFTKWSIVYDISNKKIYFKTQRFTAIKQVAFSSFEWSCPGTAKAWKMNQTGDGDVSKKFVDFSTAINKKLVETAFTESESRIPIDKETIATVWQYAARIGCQ